MVCFPLEGAPRSLLANFYNGMVAVCALFHGWQVMAKIEKPQAVDDLEGIVALCDAIMVARCVSTVVLGYVCNIHL